MFHSPPVRRSLLLLALCAPPAAAADIVVGPGQSIQAAIQSAVDGDRVLVQPGTYDEEIDFGSKAIEVLAVGGPSATSLHLVNGGPQVVRFDAGVGQGSVLAGFHITRTDAFPGFANRGIMAFGGSPLLRDLVIEDIQAANTLSAGGAVMGAPRMERCIVRNCSAYDGGAVFGPATLIDCLFEDNLALGGGGAVHGDSGPIYMQNCRVLRNASTFEGYGGGGIYAPNGGTLLNCLIADNTSGPSPYQDAGGGVRGPVDIKHCTIVGNTCETGPFSDDADGVFEANSIENSIVRGNGGVQLLAIGSVSHSNVEGGFAGSGNIDLDPLFVDPSLGDYHLQPGSPCVDAGLPGTSDPDGSPADLGYSWQRALYSDLSAVSLSAGGTQKLTLYLGPPNAGELYILLGSLSGTSPGLPVGSFTLPLVYDAYTNLLLADPGSAPVSHVVAALDANGRVEATFRLPAGTAPGLAGLTAHHAFFTFNAGFAVSAVSNAEPVQLVP